MPFSASFGPTDLGEDQAPLLLYLRTRYPEASFTITHSEYGAIPLGFAPQRTTGPRHVLIGAKRGPAKHAGPREFGCSRLSIDTSFLLVSPVQVCLLRLGKDRSGWIESLHNEPDAKTQLPNELRDDHEAPQHRHWLEDPEQYADETSEEHRTNDESQQGHAPGHQARAVHQVAQYQPVPDADDEARSEQKRSIMERDERLDDGEERAGIRTSGLLARSRARGRCGSSRVAMSRCTCGGR